MAFSLTCVLKWSLLASENDLLNKRLKLDYEEITPCLKEVTTVWEKMLSTPGRSKIKFDMEKMHSAVGQGKLCGQSVQPSLPRPDDWGEVWNKKKKKKCSSPILVAISLLVTISFPNLFPDILTDVSYITFRIPFNELKCPEAQITGRK